MRDPKAMASGLTMLFVGLAELVLGLRAIFLLLDGDKSNSFINWVIAMSEPLLEPINGFISATQFSQRFVLDFRTLAAMAFWAVLGYTVLALLEWLRQPRPGTGGRWRKWFTTRS